MLVRHKLQSIIISNLKLSKEVHSFMPITIDTTASALQNASLTSDPKWFHSTLLTGKGGSRGLLNQATAFATSAMIPEDTDTFKATGFINTKMNRKSTNGLIETNTIVTSPLPIDTITTHYEEIRQQTASLTEYDAIMEKFFENHQDLLTEILPDDPKAKAQFNSLKLYIAPMQLQIRSDKAKGSSSRQLRTHYRVSLLSETANGHKRITSTVFWDDGNVNAPFLIKNWLSTKMPYNMSFIANPDPSVQRNQLLDDALQDFTLYQALSTQVEIWTEHLSELASIAMDYYSQFLNPADENTCVTYANNVSLLCKYMSQYNINLNVYKVIFDKLNTTALPTTYRTAVLYSNLQLLLFGTLTNLYNSKDSLASMVTPTPAPTVPAHFTASQRGAITDESPLILTQAGAGTGKSTTLLARIDYMKACGIDPETITVLSFTNAGADNIAEKNPRIQSMTIARMIHEIYAHNYPTHQLSTVDTLANSLFAIEKYVSHADRSVLKELVSGLRDIRNNKHKGYMIVLDLVTNNWDSVQRLLDETQQTTLELEIITAYAQIDTLNVPDQFKTKHLIIDEVQDNSLFEFIYTLKYANKFQTSLFMVGDGSQTLYEFRASNPKALNILEMTEYFSTHQLTTNYRSNQEVLDYANQVLSNIEANQFAKIQLTSNDLTPVTKKSFQEKIKLVPHYIDRLSDVDELLEAWLMQPVVQEYVAEKLLNNERVAFLSHKGNHVKIMEETLKRVYPQYTVVNLRNDRPYTLSLFSEFLKEEADTVNTLPIDQFHGAFYHAFSKYISQSQSKQGQASTLTQKYADIMLTKWTTECQQDCANVALAYKNKQLTTDQARKELTSLVLQCEIRHNAMLQSIATQRSEERKNSDDAQNAPLVVSTIHSAKGLEFDNVVLLVMDDKLPVQEQMRMYYVGMTRAQKSELVMAVSKTKRTTLETIYDTLLEQY